MAAYAPGAAGQRTSIEVAFAPLRTFSLQHFTVRLRHPCNRQRGGPNIRAKFEIESVIIPRPDLLRKGLRFSAQGRLATAWKWLPWTSTTKRGFVRARRQSRTRCACRLLMRRKRRQLAVSPERIGNGRL